LVALQDSIEGVFKPGNERDRQIAIRYESTVFTNLTVFVGCRAIVPDTWNPINEPIGWTFGKRVITKDWIRYQMSTVSVTQAANDVLKSTEYTIAAVIRWPYGEPMYLGTEATGMEYPHVDGAKHMENMSRGLS
jgi:hypothetical protein